MIEIISESVRQEIPDTLRICLPNGIELLDLARWLGLSAGEEQRFEIISGSEKQSCHGRDAIALFIEIQSKCANNNVSDSILRSSTTGALYFFDRHERFSFFTAEKDERDRLFPFSSEIMWENFALLQEEDEEFSLREIFDMVHTG